MVPFSVDRGVMNGLKCRRFFFFVIPAKPGTQADKFSEEQFL